MGGKLISSSHKKYYLPPEKRNFGMVFQAFAVWPHLNVLENVAFPLRLQKLSKHEILKKAREALRHTNLLAFERTYPNELSGGEKQRIALARAMAINPSVMLLDEPLSNLDPKLREEMRFEIKELQRRFGFTVIYVTHDQAEAMALSDRIMVMRSGVAVQVDTPLEIYNNPADRFVFSFIGLSNFIPVTHSDGLAYVQGAPECGAICESPPLPGQCATLACRPTEIDLVAEGGVRARILHKAFLGETVDYRLEVGGHEIRVQKNRREAGFKQDELCGLVFHRVLWY